jgi:hypothetical protein
MFLILQRKVSFGIPEMAHIAALDLNTFDLAGLEGIERDAWLDLYAASPPSFASAAGLSATRIGSGAIFAIRAVPLIQFNHAHALGLDAPLDAKALDAVIGDMEAKVSAVWALQLPDLPDYAHAATLLNARGFSAEGRWAKFRRTAAAPPPAKTSLKIAEVGPDKGGDFGAVVQQGFGAPAPFAGWAAAIVGRAGWRAFVGYDGADPVAAGALFLAGGLGWLGLGATLPSHRGRGAQGAILSERISAAHEAGAHTVVTETGKPLPGKEAAHPSYRNILRAGFGEVYVRLNYRPHNT